MIELRTINENNYTDCLNLKASVANTNFVDSVAYSLAEAWVHYKDTKPFAIYADETMIGFVSMYVGEENYQIINFLIDDAYQKKGYGTAAAKLCIATVYKGNIIKNLIMDCQSYTKYRPNETTGGIFVSWRRKEELPTGA